QVTEVILDNQLRNRPQWNVQVVSEGVRLLIDARPEGVLEMRACAEWLARALRCPLVDASTEYEAVAIQWEDLNLPLAERLRKYPALMGPMVERPSALSVMIEEGPGTLRRFAGASVVPTMVLAALVFGGGVMVASLLPGGFGRPSLMAAAMESGNYAMFGCTAVLIALLLAIGLGPRWVLEADAQEVRLQHRFVSWQWWQEKLPWAEIEEVHVTRRGVRCYVNVISDRRVLTIAAQDAAEAAWMAWELRMFGIQTQP
ncbi:MAG: hypothetical protein ACYCW6_05625, partial [Candidatus Xenobia bacterium]